MTRYYSRSSRTITITGIGAVVATLLAGAGTSPAFAQAKKPPTTQKPAPPATTRTLKTVTIKNAETIALPRSVAEILDHAAALRTEAERRAYEASSAPVASGYNDASSGMTRMLSVLGQYNRLAPTGGAAPTTRTEAQRDVNALWSVAKQTPSSVQAGRLRRAAYLYAQAAGRYFAAETREGRPAAATLADAGDTGADGTDANSADNGALAAMNPYNGQAYAPYYAPSYVISPGYGYGNQVIIPGGFYGYGGGLLTISPYGQVGVW